MVRTKSTNVDLRHINQHGVESFAEYGAWRHGHLRAVAMDVLVQTPLGYVDNHVII